MKVAIYHNVNRDFEDNQLVKVFEYEPRYEVLPEGVFKELPAEKQTDGSTLSYGVQDSHTGQWAVSQDGSATFVGMTFTEAVEAFYALENDYAFENFNVGNDEVAKAYRSRKLQLLSVGDVVQYPGKSFSCESVGWKARELDELNVVTDPAEAEKLVRERYEIKPDEELVLTVPWTA